MIQGGNMSSGKINQVIASKLTMEVTKNVEVLFSNMWQAHDKTFMSCTCVCSSGNIDIGATLNLINLLDAVKEVASQDGILFTYSIMSMEEFDLEDDKIAKKLGSSSILYYKDSKYLGYLDTVKESPNGIKKK